MNILTYKGYHGKFEYDPDADIFHGEVLYLNDIITFQGRSIDELKEALAESIEVYLEYCEKKGRAPQKPFSGNFNIRISPEIHQQIALRAAHDGISLNKWVSNALRHAISLTHA